MGDAFAQFMQRTWCHQAALRFGVPWLDDDRAPLYVRFLVARWLLHGPDIGETVH